MVEILAIASVIAPVTNGVVQAVKSASNLNKRFIPVTAVAVGIGLGAAAFFVDVSLGERLWAGGISGLASVGLFEISKNTKGEGK
ncbi:putative membrane protein [Salirhabdus euzebyi]|uniref:Putative membrane protein n=1 Tax=Salirhabdus euzebyi TaxID=394506 RepID=A0A841PT19_9BACI|nr:holin [Salirhabdus euzebyi]MBB6451969.1 putative membrane protein [Salirhabdus euzebyi]